MANSSTGAKQGGKKTNARHKIITGLTVLLSVLLIFMAGILVYGFTLLSGMRENPNDYKPTDFASETDDPSELEGLTELDPSTIGGAGGKITSDENVINIMLFGLDTRSKTELTSGLSDVMIILTMDNRHKCVKMTSIMRDSLIKLDNGELRRANELFKRLGPLEAAKKLGSCFGLEVRNYITVNFECTAKIVDALGGVELKITGDEMEQINLNIEELYGNNSKYKMTGRAGVRKLNGVQAVAYARIRHLAGYDFNRTQRQRNVLAACFAKLPDMTLDAAISLAIDLSQYVKTSLTELQMIEYMGTLFDLRKGKLMELRVPLNDTYKNGKLNNQFVLKLDFEANAEAVRQFIFENKEFNNEF